MSNKPIKRLVIHCSATKADAKINAATIKDWHTKPKSKGGRGWSDIGYHAVGLVDGGVEQGRSESVAGAHVAGFNTGSLGFVYVGGIDANGKAADTRTSAQKRAMKEWIIANCEQYGLDPKRHVMGHRDLSPDKDGDGIVEKHEWLKDCPCFDVRGWIKQGMPI